MGDVARIARFGPRLFAALPSSSKRKLSLPVCRFALSKLLFLLFVGSEGKKFQ